MASVEDKPTEVGALEQELEELEKSERALEGRTNGLTVASMLGLILGGIALMTSIIAIVVALSNNDNSGMGHSQALSSSKPATSGMGSGHMMGSASTGASGAVAPAGVHTVNVKLGEMWVRPQYTSVSAGKVTFIAHNTGQVTHELMVERTPLKMDGPGRPNEDAAQGMIEDMQPRASGRMTLRLKPGSYVLFCNVPGHFAAGQHVRFTVRGS